MRKIYGIVGGIGSGKDTIADYLMHNHYFKRESFASVLKDSVASIFGWDRAMLEGVTKESRHKREVVDQWWSDRLGLPELSPRWALQQIGTNVFRDCFHEEIWIASLENKIKKSKDSFVVSDCRFENEVVALKKLKAKIIHVKRGPDPDWKNDAISAGCGNEAAIERLEQLGVHTSEWKRFSLPVDYIITNDGTLDELYAKIEKIM